MTHFQSTRRAADRIQVGHDELLRYVAEWIEVVREALDAGEHVELAGLGDLFPVELAEVRGQRRSMIHFEVGEDLAEGVRGYPIFGEDSIVEVGPLVRLRS